MTNKELKENALNAKKKKRHGTRLEKRFRKFVSSYSINVMKIAP